MATLRIDGVGIAYDDTGNGAPPMLLVHGWGANRTHFAPQVGHLARAHRVVAVDLRGHGRSPRGPYSPDAWADDVLESVPGQPDLALGHSPHSGSTERESVDRAKARTTAVLPTPGSPETERTPPRPSTASSSARRRSSSSRSRPTSPDWPSTRLTV